MLTAEFILGQSVTMFEINPFMKNGFSHYQLGEPTFILGTSGVFSNFQINF